MSDIEDKLNILLAQTDRRSQIRRWTDPATGEVYENVGPNQPPDFNAEDYGGKAGAIDMQSDGFGGKKFFRGYMSEETKDWDISPGKKWKPMNWYRKVDPGFPTS